MNMGILVPSLPAAVGGQESRVLSVEAQALLGDDEHGDFGPILTGVEDLFGLVGFRVEFDLGPAEDF